MKKTYLTIACILTVILALTACANPKPSMQASDYTDWDSVVRDGSGKTVTIFMWGGNESVNQYMDQYVAGYLKSTYDVTLKRVPMNPPDYLSKLINEKKASQSVGTGDLLWINAENFLTAKTAGLLSGPFTGILPNLNAFYDLDASDLAIDSGIPIEGYEAIWGRAQLVFSYDEAVMPNPPKTYAEFLEYAKQNPGKLTFPRIPDDFAGTSFFRNAFYELTGESFDSAMTQEEFFDIAQPVIEYFKELKPYLWNGGDSFPATQAQLDELFKNGEVHMTMGFEVGKTAGLVAAGVYPQTVGTYVFDTGTIGNSHYLAIPFNAPEPAAALLVIDFLQSPAAQLEKMKADVWGDMPALDATKLPAEQQDALGLIEDVDGAIPLEELGEKRLPDMSAEQIDWVKALWEDNLK
jgi:putative spermidine/putrescine transport system substrate-binding protein